MYIILFKIVIVLMGFVGILFLFWWLYLVMAEQNIVALIFILIVLIALVLIFKDQLTAMINDWWVMMVENRSR